MFSGLEHLDSPSLQFSGVYEAEVIDDTDTDDQGSGRVQVRVFPMMVGVPAAVLPWATPAFGLFEGGASGVGAFTVPEKNSRVYVFFRAGDVYAPVYFASAPSKSDGPGSKPSQKVWQSRRGHKIEIDDTSGEEKITVEHKGGAKIEIDVLGKVTVTSVGNIELKGAGLPAGGGVVTTLHTCMFTGTPHPVGSVGVKASL